MVAMRNDTGERDAAARQVSLIDAGPNLKDRAQP